VTLKNNLKIQEEMVTYIVRQVLEKRRRELEVTEAGHYNPCRRVEPPFERISYSEADGNSAARLDIQDRLGGRLGKHLMRRHISLQFEKPVFHP
jgi:asparaginyl-tRNA synthetase